jgi:predicted Zn-dependent protease
MKMDKSIIDFLNKKKECEDVVLVYEGEDSNLTRVGENRITQNMSKKIEKITVEAVKEGRIGSAVTTANNRDAILKSLRDAEEIASHIPRDPEFVPPLEPADCTEVNREVESTAKATPLMKAEKILRIIEKAKKKKATVAGSFSNEQGMIAIMNTRGLSCSHRFTNADFSVTVSVDDASGFASAVDEDIEKIDVDSLFEDALKKAELGKNPMEIEPGDYPVFIDNLALGDFMFYLVFLMQKRSADEGWSFFSGKEGTKIACPEITIFSDPAHPQNPSVPFDISNGGLPLNKKIWIENGVLKELWTSRYWAEKNGIEATGMPTNLIMEGGKLSREDIISKIDYGLLVNRFWYIRFVNRQELILTGMTRDGLFLIEDGKISKAVKNMRFNDSPFSLLNSLKYLGEGERVYGKNLVPSIFAEKFHFASATKF